MSLEDESASVQGDVLLPWPLATAGSLIKKKLLGLSYWFVLNLEAGCQQHFKCECGGSAIMACCCRDSWLLLTAILPVHAVCAEVTNMQPFNPNDCLSWNGPLGREVMTCWDCTIEWNSLLSTGLNHRGQSHLGCILRSFMFLIYCGFVSFTARLAILQIVTDFLGLLRKPGTQQRLQLPQTSGLHAGKQDPTNRWNNFLSSDVSFFLLLLWCHL